MGEAHGDLMDSSPPSDRAADAFDASDDDPPGAEPMTFVVRLWREWDEQSGRETWRGHVKHVESRRRRGVRTADDVAAFVRQAMEAAGGVGKGRTRD